MKLWLQLWICPYHLTWLTKFRLAVCTSKWNMARLQPENCWNACVLCGAAVICADYHILGLSPHKALWGNLDMTTMFWSGKSTAAKMHAVLFQFATGSGSCSCIPPLSRFSWGQLRCWGSQESYLPAKDEEQQGAQPTQMCWDSSRRNNSQHCKWQ